MATELEFYKGSTTTQGSFTSTTYVDYLSVTVDRTGKAGAKNFFIFGSCSTRSTNTTSLCGIRMRVDDTTIVGVSNGTGFDFSNDTGTPPHGMKYFWAKRVSLDASSHNIDIEISRRSGSGTIHGENAAICIIEESANAEYAEDTTTQREDGTTFVDATTLTFTPATEQNYLVAFYAEFSLEDESDGDSNGIRFQNSTDSNVYFEENHSELVGASNDNIFRLPGGAAFENLEATEHTLAIQISGGGTIGDEAVINRRAIIAIPFADFENAYTDSNTSTNEVFTGNSFTDSTVDITPTLNAADHMVLCGSQVSNESVSHAGAIQLDVDGGSVLLPMYHPDDRDGDNDEWYITGIAYGATFDAGATQFTLMGNSSGTSATTQGMLKNIYMMIFEIPAGPGDPDPTITSGPGATLPMLGAG